MRKWLLGIASVLIVLTVGAGVHAYKRIEAGSNAYDLSLKKIRSRNALQRLAEQAVEDGRYAEALQIYQNALGTEHINADYEKAHIMAPMVKIKKHLKEYEEALRVHQWFLNQPDPAPSALEEVDEIKALMHYRDTGDKSRVLEHIEHLKKTYAAYLPPSGADGIHMADLLRLYDSIEEYDRGAVLAREALELLHQQEPTLDHLDSYGEASARSAEWIDGKFNTDYRGYKVMAEYLKVIEAYQADKAAGTKGRATKAIIESNYFPW